MSSTGARRLQVQKGRSIGRVIDLRDAVRSPAGDTAGAWRATLDDFGLTLPCTEQAARWARHWLRSIEMPLRRDAQEQLRLLAHELLRNSVEHSGSSEMTIKVEVGAGAVRVEVSDEGAGTDLTPRNVEPFASSGRGLMWVEHLADSWGIDREGRTTVWFEMKRHHDPDQTGSGAASENS